MLTYEKAKKQKLKKVFSLNIYGGVDCFELDWKTHIVWLNDNICDDYKGISEFFSLNSENLYETLKDLVKDYE